MQTVNAVVQSVVITSTNMTLRIHYFIGLMIS